MGSPHNSQSKCRLPSSFSHTHQISIKRDAHATSSRSFRNWHATQQPFPYLVPSSKLGVHSRSTRGGKRLGKMANTPFYLVSLLLLFGAISAFHQQVLTKLTTLYRFHMTPISLLLLSLFVTVT